VCRPHHDEAVIGEPVIQPWTLGPDQVREREGVVNRIEGRKRLPPTLSHTGRGASGEGPGRREEEDQEAGPPAQDPRETPHRPASARGVGANHWTLIVSLRRSFVKGFLASRVVGGLLRAGGWGETPQPDEPEMRHLAPASRPGDAPASL